jgi:ferredoxin
MKPVQPIKQIYPLNMKIPVVELSDCIHCDVCVEVCPSVFNRNDADYVEVADLNEYPEPDVEEAIKNCPADCIAWTEI